MEGRGTYAFIPDANIVGTCFVNCVANAVSTLAQTAELHLIPKNGAEFAGAVCGGLPTSETTWGRVVRVGPLQFGQLRQVVVPMRIPPGSESFLEAVVVHENTIGK